jgi:hypothetical protein
MSEHISFYYKLRQEEVEHLPHERSLTSFASIFHFSMVLWLKHHTSELCSSLSVCQIHHYRLSSWKLQENIHWYFNISSLDLLKLQCLQKKFLCTNGNFPRPTPVCNLHTAFNLPYVYNYKSKLCKQQAEVIKNHENEHVGSIRQVKARCRNIRDLNLVVVKLTTT